MSLERASLGRMYLSRTTRESGYGENDPRESQHTYMYIYIFSYS